jgi:hypothetical protein
VRVSWSVGMSGRSGRVLILDFGRTAGHYSQIQRKTASVFAVIAPQRPPEIEFFGDVGTGVGCFLRQISAITARFVLEG